MEKSSTDIDFTKVWSEATSESRESHGYRFLDIQIVRMELRILIRCPMVKFKKKINPTFFNNSLEREVISRVILKDLELLLTYAIEDDAEELQPRDENSTEADFVIYIVARGGWQEVLFGVVEHTEIFGSYFS